MHPVSSLRLLAVRLARLCAVLLALSFPGVASASSCEFLGTCGGGQNLDKQTTQGVCVGHPINIATRVKRLAQEDYAAKGLFAVSLTRNYSSRRPDVGGTPGGDGLFGPNWRSDFDRRVSLPYPNSPMVQVFRADGRVLEFLLANGAWTPDADVPDRLARIGSGAYAGWRYTDSNDAVESYDAQGRLLSITQPNGLTQTLTYDAQGKLATVSDPAGRALAFAYNANGFVSTMTGPGGGTFAYAYDAQDNLVSVTYPDGQTRSYHYNEADLTQGAYLPRALTGITDERGIRFASYGYDSQGQGISTELAGGADRNTISYGANRADVVDALGTFRRYRFQLVLGVAHCSTVSGSPVAAHPEQQFYNANGYVTTRIDWNSNRTDYDYNARGLETLRFEGLTLFGEPTPATRRITTDWHAEYRLPVRIAEPLRSTTFTYGASTDANIGNRGSLLTKTMQATTDVDGSLGFSAALTGQPRTWTYSYNADGQVLAVDGPRTDVSDVTSFTYYARDATCSGVSTVGCRGRTATITNALGHTTTIDEYDVHGQPLRITDSNGLVTTFAYDARQRVTSQSAGGEVTTYAYDPAGNLARVTLPDGSSLGYTYDAAQRLTQLDDSLGNRIAYTLDLMGNRTRTDVLDPASALAQTRTRVYDAVNLLAQEIGAQNQTTRYSYDRQGNLTVVIGPLGDSVDFTQYAYDALNRLTRVTDQNNGQVNYGYNGLDMITSIADPRGILTTYAYDGLGNLTQQVSPDAGSTYNTYDAAGNLLTATDAKGQQLRYAYDALNRITTVEHRAGSPLALTATHVYTYDGGTGHKGRLTAVAEPDSTTAYGYDQKGRLTSEVRTINAVPYATAYSYDAAGRLTGLTYPGGTAIAYSLDTLGRVQSIAATKNGTLRNVLSSVAYRPFGPTAGFTFGNGQTYARGYDADGRVSSYTLAVQSFAVGYDAGSRIQSIAQDGVPANTNSYAYDLLGRLTNAVQQGTTQAFGYDAAGNRTTKTTGSATATYDYPSTSNRINAISGSGARTYAHDAVGSIVSDATRSFTYDARGRMTRSVGLLGTTDYKVNALGQRIRKTNAQGDTVYHYDAQGRLIAESSTSGTIQKEYIYLGDTPVGVLQ